MSVCEICQFSARSECSVLSSYKMQAYLLVLRNGLSLETNQDLVPEIEDRKIQSELNKLKTQLRATAIEKGCKEFK